MGKTYTGGDKNQNTQSNKKCHETEILTGKNYESFKKYEIIQPNNLWRQTVHILLALSV